MQPFCLNDVKQRLKRNNRILFTRESNCLEQLRRLICEQDHRTLALWALRCVEEPVRQLEERYPEHDEPRQAQALCMAWAKGQIKMPAAKRAILAVHAMAKQLEDPADVALCHAVGQGCAAVHVETHAIGLPMYELTAIVRRCGIKQCETAIEQKMGQYMQQMELCRQEAQHSDDWVDFLLDTSRPNKERLLLEQQNDGAGNEKQR